MTTGDTTSGRVRIATADGSMGAYVARPARPHRGVIVGHQLFGVTADVTDIADRLAGMDLLAVVPEFYHRSGPGIVLDADEKGRARGFELLNRVTRETLGTDLDATIAWLDGQGIESVGMVGVSVGGHFAYYAAAQYRLDFIVALYPTFLTSTDIPLSTPEPTLELTAGIRGSLMLVVGEQDQIVTTDQREAIAARLEAEGIRHEIVNIPGAAHAFMTPLLPSYDAAATEYAWIQIRRAIL